MSGRNTDGRARLASAVVTGDWWASRCGLKPAPRSSTATTIWLGCGAAVGGGGAGAGGAGAVHAVSRAASSVTTSAVALAQAPPTVTRPTSRPGGVPNHTLAERLSTDGGSPGASVALSWTGDRRCRQADRATKTITGTERP